jgi:hypothetical protein
MKPLNDWGEAHNEHLAQLYGDSHLSGSIDNKTKEENSHF